MSQTNKAEVKLEAVVLCEDGRPEANGKTTLLGVYGGNILVASFPAFIVLSLWVELDALSTGVLNFSVRFKLGDEIAASLDGTIEFHAVGPSGFSIPQIPVKIDKESDLLVEMNFGNDVWHTAKKKHVSLGNVQSPGLRPMPPPPSG